MPEYPYDDLISVLRKLPPDIKALINVELVGDGPEEQCIRELIRSLGLESVISMKPKLSAEKVRELMRSWDVFVFPSSRKEGWGAVLPEAMDAGCAVVACAEAGSTLELVRHAENGLVFDGCDVDALSRHILSLVKDSELRVSLGRKAWKTAQDWSPQSGAKKLVELARSLFNGYAVPDNSPGLCGRVG